MIDPHNSPWRRPPRIHDLFLYHRWRPIQKYLRGPHHYRESNGLLLIDDVFFIAKNSSRMRLKSHIDWVHYTAKTLAEAMNQDRVPEYYESQMRDPRSPANQWARSHQEQELKTRSAHRAGRANWILGEPQ